MRYVITVTGLLNEEYHLKDYSYDEFGIIAIISNAVAAVD